MIEPERLYQFLQEKGVDFFTGVPDSLLKHFLKYIDDHSAEAEHIITANEGLALALASGYHFKTGKLPLVYLQNSGLGNLINPLTSLADAEMYGVPLLLLIGWRGKPGTKDEPQHLKMGRITLPLLNVLEVPYYLLNEDMATSFAEIDKAIQEAITKQKPVAIVAPEGIFSAYGGKPAPNNYSLPREKVIREIIDQLQGDETVVCTTGKSGREFYEQNMLAGNKISKFFLCVGAMGHANHIALGLQIDNAGKTIMIDGDGAILMHMGALSTLGHYAGRDFIHIVLNNGSHESVGAQPTEAYRTDLCAVAKACGYSRTVCITDKDQLRSWLSTGLSGDDTQFVEIRVNNMSRTDLVRPAGNPAGWKKDLMNALQQKNN
jgi:phosphonopyruvate decarboxylase